MIAPKQRSERQPLQTISVMENPPFVNITIDILGDDLPETAKKKVKMKLAYQASVSKQELRVCCMIIRCLVACIKISILQDTWDVYVCVLELKAIQLLNQLTTLNDKLILSYKR